MSQHDYDIANQAFAATRADINAALQALATNGSGATAPATTFAFMWWADTTAGILKQRNAANSAWVSVLNLATGAPVVAVPDGSITPAKLSQPPTLGTAVATTSGTAIDFTGIPSWAKKITVMLNGVSTNGSSNLIVQIGDSGGIEATGYLCGVAGNASSATFTTGFGLSAGGEGAATIRHGMLTIQTLGANVWACSGVIGRSDAAQASSTGGNKTLSDTLDRVRITTVNGTDTFDLGSANILIE